MNTQHKNYIRVAALGHSALGTYMIKVIFRDGGHDKPDGEECAYWMKADTYHMYDLGEKHTLEDYQLKGDCVEADNTDIYNNH